MSKRSEAAPKHSPEQLAKFAGTFAPKARRYRLQSRIGIGGLLVCLVGGMYFARWWPMAFLIGFIGAALLGVFVIIRTDFE